MKTKSKSNLPNMEQKELSKLSNDEIIVTKPADKGEPVVILSTGHYQNMIMQQLLDESTYKTLASSIDIKIQRNFAKLLRKYKMCFTEPNWKFLNDKHHKARNFYGLPKIHKSMIIESAIDAKNCGITEIFEPNYLRLRPIVGGPKRSTRKLSQLFAILLKPFLTHIKSFIRDSSVFLNKCSRDLHEDTEIVTLGVISLYTSISHEYDLADIDYQKDLQVSEGLISKI